MTDDEIFDALDGRVVGGKHEEQDEAKEWIATFLASVEDNEKLVNIDWNVVIPAKNSSALAEAIKMLIMNPDVCREMGIEGRKMAEERFDEQKVIDQHLSLYDQIALNAK